MLEIFSYESTPVNQLFRSCIIPVWIFAKSLFYRLPTIFYRGKIRRIATHVLVVWSCCPRGEQDLRGNINILYICRVPSWALGKGKGKEKEKEKENAKEKEKERGKELLALALGPATKQKRIPNAKYLRYNSKEHNTKTMNARMPGCHRGRLKLRVAVPYHQCGLLNLVYTGMYNQR